jgi:hypothetical protein
MIKKPHSPRTIREIWKEIHLKNRDLRFFRLRNTKTLEDIMITGINSWEHGLPNKVQAIKCSDVMYTVYEFDCIKNAEWALISSSSEISWLSAFSDWREATQKLKISYRKTAYKSTLIPESRYEMRRNPDAHKYKEVTRWDHSY